MNLSTKSITNRVLLPKFKNLIRSTSKISVEVDENVLQKFKDEESKPRHHPGISKRKRFILPANINRSLEKVIADYPIKALMEHSKKLNQMIFSRHPPVEDVEVKGKIKRIINEIGEMKTSVQLEQLSELEQKKLQQRKQQLLQRRVNERTFSWKPLQYGQYESIVYAVARGAREFSVLMSIFEELTTRDPSFKPQSYFDFGSGVGTGMWAGSNLWKDTIFEYFNVDASRDMNELSELILRDGNENQQMTLRNVFYRQFLPSLEARYDLVVCSYSLFELPSSKDRLSVILNLWKKCDGYLIIVEEGTRRGFELVNEARNFILSVEEHSLIGHVFAPCPHDDICPRLSNPEDRTPCNFEITFAPTDFNKNNNETSSARFSYVVLKKGLPEDNTRLWPRLVRPTLIRSKHAICRMCTSDGKLNEIKFTKSKHGSPAYKCAKASRWGDRLPITIGETYETITRATKISRKKQNNTTELKEPSNDQ